MNPKNTVPSMGKSDVRMPYNAPRLTVFGMVKNLTATGSAQGKEMTNAMAMA